MQIASLELKVLGPGAELSVTVPNLRVSEGNDQSFSGID